MKDSMGMIYPFPLPEDQKPRKSAEVAKGNGHEIGSFNELSNAVATLSFYNPHLNLFFRGQTKDYSVNGVRVANEDSSLFPTAFRRAISEVGRVYLNQILPKRTDALCKALRREFPHHKRDLLKGMAHYRETLWAVLQHYGCPTPLLDVTASLHVACSFATQDVLGDSREDTYVNGGIVYVLGLPNIHGLITHSPSDSLVIVRLQAACPPEARRPHYQHGFLVGSVPHDAQRYPYKMRDFRHRLVAKFRITNGERFWSKQGGYSALSKSMLMPDADPLATLVNRIVAEYPVPEPTLQA